MSIYEIALELLEHNLVRVIKGNTILNVEDALTIYVSFNFNIEELLSKYNLKIKEKYDERFKRGESNCIQYLLVKNK